MRWTLVDKILVIGMVLSACVLVGALVWDYQMQPGLVALNHDACQTCLTNQTEYTEWNETLARCPMCNVTGIKQAQVKCYFGMCEHG
jgi:hypothetical protein